MFGNRYMSGEVTPEQMAELIKQLVDDFNVSMLIEVFPESILQKLYKVVVPLESYSTNASSFSDDHSSMGRQVRIEVQTQ